MIKKTYPIHIRFNDLDSLGHVNNAVYLSYFEQGRMDYFSEMGGENWDWTQEGTLLARNEIDYKVPIFLQDKARIELWVSDIGTKSFSVNYRILKDADGQEIECTVGKSIMVCFDYKAQKSIPVPERWRQKFGN